MIILIIIITFNTEFFNFEKYLLLKYENIFKDKENHISPSRKINSTVLLQNLRNILL